MKRKWLEALSLAEDKYIMEADPEAVVIGKNKRWLPVLAACFCCVIAVSSLVLFLPFNSDPPDISQYADSEYYALMEKLNEATSKKPAYKNNFELLVSALKDFVEDGMAIGADKNLSGAIPEAGSNDIESIRGTGYQEITDNQVSGVIEADRIKRSDSHIYYLDGDILRVYPIAGEVTREIGSFQVCDEEFMRSPYVDQWEFYLSKDCHTVTVIAPYYSTDSEACVAVIKLDVSDPADIRKVEQVCVTGSHISSRMTQSGLLLLTRYKVNASKMDFRDATTFVPCIDSGDGEKPISASQIIVPESLTNTCYTVALMLEPETLAVAGSTALLSYSQEVYVSAENLYAIRSFDEPKTDRDGNNICHRMTQITGLSYHPEGFEANGSVTVEGYVKDRYSMDEYEGILRVVTTTETTSHSLSSRQNDTVSSMEIADWRDWSGNTNANLYCISLSDWQIVAQVLQFAPAGETVQSTRFDGAIAYVCTSVQLSDPVFFFDLSDLKNITFSDTGKIEGYSTSLVDFENGNLLGIGVGNSFGSLKVEIYTQGQDGVESVCQYVLENTYYATSYKGYYIDRENQLVGMGVFTSDQNGVDYTGSGYLLLMFDGYELRRLVNVPLSGDLETMRGVYVDGYFYMFGTDGAFRAEKVF